MNKSWMDTTRIIVFSIILGGAAGVVTAALTTNYLADYALQLSELTEPLRIGEQRPVAFPSSMEEAIQRLTDEGLVAIAQLTNTTETDVLALSDESIVPAVILTSDGWMLAHQGTLPLRAITESGVCDIDTRVEDSRTNFQFIKCDEQSLPVAGFGSGLDTQVGEQVFVVTSREGFVTTTVSEIYWTEDLRHPLDQPARRLILQHVSVPEGAPVFNLSAKLIGIVEEVLQTGEVSVLPIDSLLPKFNRILVDEEMNIDTLGLQGVDLAHILLPESQSRGHQAGVLIYGPALTELGSYYQVGQIEKDDILLSVNHETITDSRSVDEILLSYELGDEIVVLIDRDGEEIELTITLGVFDN